MKIILQRYSDFDIIYELKLNDQHEQTSIKVKFVRVNFSITVIV